MPPLQLTAPALADLPNGPGSTLACLRLALLLVTDSHGRYVVMIQGPGEHQPDLWSKWRACRSARPRTCWPSWTGSGPSSTSTAATCST